MRTAIVLLAAARAAMPAAAADAPAPIGLTAPKAGFTLMVPGAGFEVTLSKVKPDGTAAYYMLADSARGIGLSFFIEPVDPAHCTTAAGCRDWAWKAEQTRLTGIEGVRESEIGDAAVVEYLQPFVGQLRIDQQNMHAYWVKDGYWIDAHISKAAFKEPDRDRFVALVRAIRFTPKSAGAP